MPGGITNQCRRWKWRRWWRRRWEFPWGHLWIGHTRLEGRRRRRLESHRLIDMSFLKKKVRHHTSQCSAGEELKFRSSTVSGYGYMRHISFRHVFWLIWVSHRRKDGTNEKIEELLAHKQWINQWKKEGMKGMTNGSLAPSSLRYLTPQVSLLWATFSLRCLSNSALSWLFPEIP